jgi:eukaryotic-like serine/threonine-protein kinase
MKDGAEQSRQQRLKELFETALELAADEREQFLQTQAAADLALQAAVQELLQAHEQAGGFLETPPLFDAARLPFEASAGQRIGPYRLLREIGRGGMATVYLATRDDAEYQQQVAIKLIWPSADSAEVLRRFRQERQILANLNHPNIARLLDGGTTEQGWPYLVMEYIAGVPITRYCNEQRLSVNTRLRLFQTVCAAVAHAHRNLVVHRDLKPSNILITVDGTVKLLDFGIAKVLAPETAGEARTRTGWQLLTPEYASPEQVREETITTASDVYSLGVLLYELLTGQRPHELQGRPLHEIIRALTEEDAPLPSRRLTPTEAANFAEASAEKLRRRLRGDLDNVILRALSKQAPPRYRTIEQLSEDLRRHLDGEPVQARPATFAYRTSKYVKRHKSKTAVLLLLCAGLVFALWQWQTTRVRERLQRRQLYAAQMRQAGLEIEEGNYVRARQLVENWLPTSSAEELRGFEWYYLWRIVHPEIRSLAYANIISGLALPTDGSLLVVGSYDGKIRVWQTATGREITTFGDHQKPIRAIAVSPNGRQVLSSDAVGVVKLWDLHTTRELLAVRHGTGRVFTVAFTPDGSKFITGSEDHTAKLWETATGRELVTFTGHTFWVQSLGITPDGQTLITGGIDAAIKFWDVRTGKQRLSIEVRAGNGSTIATTVDGVPSLAISPDGRFLAAGTLSGAVQIRRVADGKLLRILPGHEDYVYPVAFSPDSKLVTSGAADQIRLWEVETGQLLAQFHGHADGIAGLCFSPDGRLLISSGTDQRVKFWRIEDLLTKSSFTTCAKCRVHSLSFTPDGERLAVGNYDSLLQLWDWRTGRRLNQVSLGGGSRFQELAFSRSGQHLAAIKDHPTAWLLSVPELQPVQRLQGPPGNTLAVAFAPDEQTIATGGEDSLIRLWDTASGREMRVLRGHNDYIESVDFSPDGRRLASGSFDRTIKLWDVLTGAEQQTLTGHNGQVYVVRFSPRGDRLLSGGADRSVKLWDVATGRNLFTRDEHAGTILAAAFAPDGRRFTTASYDKTVRIWDAASGELLLVLKGHRNQVEAVAFSPDGQTLASGSHDHTVRLWRAAPDEEARRRSNQ